ncbi:type I secretion system permease/ATPase [Sphingomonas koreensis]|nr:type I secretion system permease/ATPase [Sphingomonas koreensis]
MANPTARNALSEALAACRQHFAYAALFSGLINLLYLAPSLFMLQVYDRVVPSRSGATLVLLTLILAFALVTLALLDMVRMRLLQRASVRLERTLAPALLVEVLGAQGIDTGERSQALRDFDSLRTILVGPAIIALFDAPWAPVYILVCCLLSPWLGLLALAAGLLLAAIAWSGEVRTRAGLRAAQGRAAEVMRLQEYSVQTAEVVRALGMREAVVANHLADRAALTVVQADTARISGLHLATTKFLRMLLQSMALALGAWLAINQQISAGSIFAASLLLGRALQPIEQTIASYKGLIGARSAYQSLVRFCDRGAFEPQRTGLPAPAGVIEAKGLTVLGPDGERRILDAIDLTALPGEIVVLVGSSGAGKSTLLRVLAGAIEADRGEVRIDGARHGDWDREALGRHIGYMPQDAALFPTSVYANIARLQPATGGDGDRRVVEAAMLAGAHDMIMKLPKAYETDLRSRDGVLSAGQRQQLALARALYRLPRMILLDEPNAHLDRTGETRLFATLSELRKRGATIIISTHRPAILQIADKIMVLRDGAVQGFGPRDEMLAREVPVAKRKTESASAAAADFVEAAE